MSSMPTHRFDLLAMAISFMAEKNKTRQLYSKYAQQVRDQVAIIEQVEQRPMRKDDWLLLAKTLGKQALRQDISARQIAESIYPILDGSGQYLASYATIPAGPAATFLLWKTGLSKKIDPELTGLLIRVIGELQKISLQQSQSTNPQPS
jgi:hypothetical protein